jgi:HK97 family phage portal protein
LNLKVWEWFKRPPGEQRQVVIGGSAVANPSNELLSFYSAGGPTAQFTRDEALQFTVIWACVKIISETIPTFPLHQYLRLPNGGRRRIIDSLSFRLSQEASDEMSAVVFWRTVLIHLLTGGDSYSYIQRNPSTFEPVALYPLIPEQVTMARVDESGRARSIDKSDWRNGKIFYHYEHPDGHKEVYNQDEILAIHAAGYSGIKAWGPLALAARRALELGRELEDFGLDHLKNSVSLTGLIERPDAFSDVEEKTTFLKDFVSKFVGQKTKRGKVGLLEDGMKFNEVGGNQDPEKSQALESRRFQVLEICRIYRMQPHKVADLSGANFSNIESENLSFLTDTLSSPIVLLESEIQRQLMPERFKQERYFEFLFDAILRADAKTRLETYRIGIQNAMDTPNENRLKENKEPQPGGDSLYIQSNMVPLSSVTLPVVSRSIDRIRGREDKCLERGLKEGKTRDEIYADLRSHIEIDLGPVAEMFCRDELGVKQVIDQYIKRGIEGKHMMPLEVMNYAQRTRDQSNLQAWGSN